MPFEEIFHDGISISSRFFRCTDTPWASIRTLMGTGYHGSCEGCANEGHGPARTFHMQERQGAWWLIYFLAKPNRYSYSTVFLRLLFFSKETPETVRVDDQRASASQSLRGREAKEGYPSRNISHAMTALRPPEMAPRQKSKAVPCTSGRQSSPA